MNRIHKLAALSKERDILPKSVTVEYDPMDLALSDVMINAKRMAEYLSAQPVYLTNENRFTGMVRLYKAEVPADLFQRVNHPYFKRASGQFYRKYLNNLVTFEWQHSAPNYKYIIENGIEGRLTEIIEAKARFAEDPEKIEYLNAVEIICKAVIDWSEKCANAHEDAAKGCTDSVRTEELYAIATACRRVPRQKATTFYEGLQSILTCFPFLPDSVGLIDRALWPLYKQDIEQGRMTREQAGVMLAEFFVMLSNFTPCTSSNADRTAECHFAIGGYTEEMEDGFTDLSKLMAETLLQIDTRRPAMSLRWTKKTPYEVLKFMLDCERKDVNKRFAFVNDEPRIEALMNICELSRSQAVKYTMVGCNEPSFPGTVWLGGLSCNAVRSLLNTFKRRKELLACENFEQFYAVYRDELAKDIAEIMNYSVAFNKMRAKDNHVVSAFLLDGCTQNAIAPNRGGCEVKIGGFNLMGVTCVIDSLSIIKQFVFEEKRVDMAHLLDVLQSNWAADPDLRTQILKQGRFFGNSDPLSDEMARRFTTELHDMTQPYVDKIGVHPLIGTLAGYNPHHMNFGAQTAATPDGRYDGDGLMVGVGQAGGRDRSGLAALLKSVAQMNPSGILCGPNVCNVLIDEVLIRNDDYFDTVCRTIEQYFHMGGIHIQLNYVSKEELLAARKDPSTHQNLRVRVSGYSTSFVLLPDSHQQEILNRTVQK